MNTLNARHRLHQIAKKYGVTVYSTHTDKFKNRWGFRRVSIRTASDGLSLMRKVGYEYARSTKGSEVRVTVTELDIWHPSCHVRVTATYKEK